MTVRIQLVALAALLVAACGHSSSVDVSISARASNKTIHDFYVIAGADKVWWSRISPGDKVTSRLKLTNAGELTVTWKLDGQSFTWRGPEIDARTVRELQFEIDTAAPGDQAIRLQSISR